MPRKIEGAAAKLSGDRREFFSRFTVLMRNRSPSLLLQTGTIVLLGTVWAVARAFRKKRRPDDVYNVPCSRSLALAVVAFAADLYAIPAVLRNKPVIEDEEIAALKLTRVSWPDRFALRLSPGPRERIRLNSDYMLRCITGLPAVLCLDRRIRQDARALAALYVWVHAVAYTVYSYSPFGPAFVDKYRPVVYYDDVPLKERARGNNRNASYSGHTGNAACASFFMAKVYCDYHPELRAESRFALYLAACLPPFLLGILRIRALKHFPSDVLLATIIGGICGVVIPEAYRERFT